MHEHEARLEKLEAEVVQAPKSGRRLRLPGAALAGGGPARSGEIVIMLIRGGIGRLYGAFVGAAVFMVAQDMLAQSDPVFWNFWIGLLLVLVVMFARGGILGLVDQALGRLRRKP